MKNIQQFIVSAAAVALGTCAVPALAQSTVEIFGDVSLGVSRSTGTSGPRFLETSSQAWANSFGFRGREDLGGGTQAIFAIVTSPGLDAGTSGNATAFWKNTYVGLANPAWGTLMIGRNDELMSTLCQYDVMCLRGVIHTLRPGNLDRVGGAQLPNMIRYHSPDLGPFRFKTYGVLGEGATSPNGRASGIQADYRSGNFAMGGAYESINNFTFSPLSPATGIGLTSFFGSPVAPTTSFAVDKIAISGLGAKYTYGAATFYGLATRVNFTYRRSESAFKSYNIGASFLATSLIEPAAGCTRVSFDAARWTLCELRTTYYFSKRTSVYAAAVREKSSGSAAVPQLFLQGGSGRPGGSTNLVATGIRHMF